MDIKPDFANKSVQHQLQELVELQHNQIILLKKKLADQKSKVDFSHFQAVVKELQDEKIAHAETQVKLEDAKEDMELARCEIATLKRKLEREKEHHELVFAAMKTKSLKESKRNVRLENQCNVMSRAVEKNAEVIHSREQHIQDLSEALHVTKATYDKHAKDSLIQQEHNNYIAKVLSDYEQHHGGKEQCSDSGSLKSRPQRGVERCKSAQRVRFDTTGGHDMRTRRIDTDQLSPQKAYLYRSGKKS